MFVYSSICSTVHIYVFFTFICTSCVFSLTRQQLHIQQNITQFKLYQQYNIYKTTNIYNVVSQWVNEIAALFLTTNHVTNHVLLTYVVLYKLNAVHEQQDCFIQELITAARRPFISATDPRLLELSLLEPEFSIHKTRVKLGISSFITLKFPFLEQKSLSHCVM